MSISSSESVSDSSSWSSIPPSPPSTSWSIPSTALRSADRKRRHRDAQHVAVLKKQRHDDRKKYRVAKRMRMLADVQRFVFFSKFDKSSDFRPQQNDVKILESAMAGGDGYPTVCIQLNNAHRLPNKEQVIINF